MKKDLTITRIRAGLYYLKYKGIPYAVCIKDTDDRVWCYMDSNDNYYYNTLAECKDHFDKLNFTNGLNEPVHFEPDWSYFYKN